MQAQLAMDSLLQAARLLDPSQQGSNNIFLDSRISQQTELRELISGKMRVKRSLATASTSSAPYCIEPRKANSTKHSRAAHNELEKNRRANLRDCLEKMKTLVPPTIDTSRNTTLALLTRARDHILHLDDVNALAQREQQQLEEKQAELKAELERLREENARLTETKHSSPAVSRPESVASCSVSSVTSRDSPFAIEYSPSTKPSPSPCHMIVDPVAEGLVPALPLCYGSRTLYPFFDLMPKNSQEIPFLPIHLLV